MNECHEDSVGLWLENEIGIIRKKCFSSAVLGDKMFLCTLGIN